MDKDMDRKSFIKNGIGLAAILAAGKAPAAIVKGLVSARAAYYSDVKHEDYIMDGILHHFDAFWNAGYDMP